MGPPKLPGNARVWTSAGRREGRLLETPSEDAADAEPAPAQGRSARASARARTSCPKGQLKPGGGKGIPHFPGVEHFADLVALSPHSPFQGSLGAPGTFERRNLQDPRGLGHFGVPRLHVPTPHPVSGFGAKGALLAGVWGKEGSFASKIHSTELCSCKVSQRLCEVLLTREAHSGSSGRCLLSSCPQVAHLQGYRLEGVGVLSLHTPLAPMPSP